MIPTKSPFVSPLGYLRVKDFASAVGTTSKRLQMLMNNGRLPHTRRGHRRFISKRYVTHFAAFLREWQESMIQRGRA